MNSLYYHIVYIRYFDPRASKINFAVPNMNSLRVFTESSGLPLEIKPGIILEGIKIKSGCKSSCVLTVDGKKLASGLTDQCGDGDLFGHEDKEKAVMEKRQCLDKDIEVIDDAIEILKEIKSLEKTDDSKKTSLMDKLKCCLSAISQRIKDLRIASKTQTMALQKFKKL